MFPPPAVVSTSEVWTHFLGGEGVPPRTAVIPLLRGLHGRPPPTLNAPRPPFSYGVRRLHPCIFALFAFFMFAPFPAFVFLPYFFIFLYFRFCYVLVWFWVWFLVSTEVQWLRGLYPPSRLQPIFLGGDHNHFAHHSKHRSRMPPCSGLTAKIPRWLSTAAISLPTSGPQNTPRTTRE